MICKNCGKEISDDSLFCTECGVKIPLAEPEPIKPEISETEQEVISPAEQTLPEAPVEQVQPPKEYKVSPVMPVQQQPAPQITQLPQAQPVSPAPVQDKKAVSTGLFILMMILGAIPVIGLIIHIITLAASKNKSLKNYSRAYVILGIIGLVLLLIGAIIGYFLFDYIQEFLSEFNINIEKLF